MTEHRTFRAPGRAAGIDERRQVIGFAGDSLSHRLRTASLSYETLRIGNEYRGLRIFQKVV